MSCRCYVGLMIVLFLPATSVAQSIRELSGHAGPITSLAFAPNGLVFATASFDRNVVIWDAASGERKLICRGHQDKVNALAFCPDCRILASAALDRTIRLWDVATGEQCAKLLIDDRCIQAMTFTANGERLLCAGESGYVHFYDLKTSSFSKRVSVSSKPLYALAVSPDGGTIAATGFDGRVHLLTLDGTRLQTLSAHEPLYSVCFDPTGTHLAAGTESGEVRVWELNSSKPITCHDPHSAAVYHVGYTNDGRRLISASVDGQVVVRQAGNGSALFTHRFPGKVLCAAISPDGTRVITGTNETAAWLLALPRRWR